MDITLLPQPNLSTQQSSKDAAHVGLPKTTAPVIEKAAIAQTEKPQHSDLPDQKTTDDQRRARIQKAAQFFKDAYVVSDTSFTIFKDMKGQYVTRFTNLRDGSVTYIPEPDIIEFMEAYGRKNDVVLSIDA